jgi:hypothetical protein
MGYGVLKDTQRCDTKENSKSRRYQVGEGVEKERRSKGTNDSVALKSVTCKAEVR